MDRRLELQSLLEIILESRNVYFQPPENIKLSYPAIVYKRDEFREIYADNLGYLRYKRYNLTYIYQSPCKEDVTEQILDLPRASFVTFFTVDHLNHDVFNLYF